MQGKAINIMDLSLCLSNEATYNYKVSLLIVKSIGVKLDELNVTILMDKLPYIRIDQLQNYFVR